MTPETSSEEFLLQRAGRGDMRAFDQLYDRMSPRLYGLLRQMLNDEKEAEDVMQDGFVYLWEHASAYDPQRSKAFTWAVMIFRNKAIDRMRLIGRRNRVVDAAVLEQAVMGETSVSGVDAEVSSHERTNEVRRALAELPTEQRRMIECAFLKGLTHHIIAESLELPLGTVKTHIRRGLLKLRDLLKGGA